jgi:hypothetical protein
MDFSADLTLFLDDFGKAVTSSALPGVTGKKGILDMAGAVLADGSVLSTDYAITVRTADFGSLKFADPIVHDGVAFTVRFPDVIDDGAFTVLHVSKV